MTAAAPTPMGVSDVLVRIATYGAFAPPSDKPVLAFPPTGGRGLLPHETAPAATLVRQLIERSLAIRSSTGALEVTSIAIRRHLAEAASRSLGVLEGLRFAREVEDWERLRLDTQRALHEEANGQLPAILAENVNELKGWCQIAALMQPGPGPFPSARHPHRYVTLRSAVGETPWAQDGTVILYRHDGTPSPFTSARRGRVNIMRCRLEVLAEMDLIGLEMSKHQLLISMSSEQALRGGYLWHAAARAKYARQRDAANDRAAAKVAKTEAAKAQLAAGRAALADGEKGA